MNLGNFNTSIILLGVLTYIAKQSYGILKLGYDMFIRMFTSKIIVSTQSYRSARWHSAIYDELEKYNIPLMRNSVDFSFTRCFFDDDDYKNVLAAPGFYLRKLPGLNMMMVRIYNEIKESSENNSNITITFVGYDHSRLYDEILEKAKFKINNKVLKVIDPMNGITRNLRTRSLDTVFFDGKEEMIEIIDNWSKQSSRDFYNRIGIAYKLGFLLHGSPGTGKSSLAVAIANAYNRDLYIYNPLSRDKEIPSNSVVLMEDIDIWCGDSRDLDFELDDGAGNNSPHKSLSIKGNTTKKSPRSDRKRDMMSSTTMSLQGLLELMDGSTSPENVIFILTTNSPSSLDEALYRPGRIHTEYFMKALNKEQAKAMGEVYSVNTDDLDLNYPVNPSELETILFKHNGVFSYHISKENKSEKGVEQEEEAC